MSACWGSAKETTVQSEARAKHFIRMWGMLAVAGLFLLYVSMHLNIRLF